jgi:hypothetical protein
VTKCGFLIFSLFQAFSEYFNRNEDAQNKRLEEMGVEVKAQNPMFKAFEQNEVSLTPPRQRNCLTWMARMMLTA